MPTSNQSLPTRHVCPWMVRAHFNEGQITRLVDEGQLITDPDPGTTPDPRDRLPNGSLSFTIWIKRPDGRILDRTHCYVCPHSLLLGNGFLDPKAMFTATEVLIVDRRHSDADTCPACGLWRPRAERALAQLAAYRKRCP